MNSGYGIIEAVAFLQKEAQINPITLLVNAKLGNPPEGVAVYLWRNPHVRMVMTRLPHERYAGQLGTVYFVYPFTRFPQENFLLDNPGFKRVWRYSKPDDKYSMDIFKKENEGL